MQEFVASFANADSLARIYPLLLQGLGLTLLLSIVTVPLAIALGLLVAVLYSFHVRFLNPLLIVYVDALRAFPVLVLLILIFYGLPFVGVNLAAFPATVVAIALNNSGYYGEIFRAGIETVPRGQRDAARSTGLTAWQTAFFVVLPQAVRNVLPDLVSNTVEVVKLTSIASVVALPELLYSADMARSITFNASPIVLAAAIYLVMLWPVVRLISRMERRIAS